ncbi:MAG TPA: metallophosphoesterase [Ktedonobacteraceae bacterium]
MQEETNNVITIVLTADNHLGYTVPGQPPRKREEQRQRQRRAFGQATDFAIGQGVDLFLQAGDLFDTPRPDEQDRSFVAARLAGLKQAGMRVFALGGVHDTPAEAHSMLGDAVMPAPQLSYASLGALHYFPPNDSPAASRRVLQPVIFDVRGIQVGICGLGVAVGQQGDPLAHSDTDPELERAAIPLLLLHAPIEGVTDGTSALDIQAQVARSTIVSQSAFRFILAGYHHAYARLSFGRTEVIVAGATQHIHFNDPDGEPGFVFLGLAADGVRWCRHITVDGVQLRRLVIPVADLWPAASAPTTSDPATSEAIAPDSSVSEDTDRVRAGLAPALENSPAAPDDTETDPTARILERLRLLCAEDAMVQVRLEGELTRQRYHQLDLNQLRRYGEEHAFALAIDDSAVTFLPDAEAISRAQAIAFSASDIEERLSPRDELIRLADEWIAGAEDEQEQQALVATKEELLAALWNL